MATTRKTRRRSAPAAPTPAAPKAGAGPAARPNPRIQTQTRRVLTQHYRAKYGVK